jgi:hypothetical protein
MPLTLIGTASLDMRWQSGQDPAADGLGDENENGGPSRAAVCLIQIDSRACV